jgi:DNA-binding response OmpR family regulator
MDQLLKSKHFSIDKRLRLVTLYDRNNLHFTSKRFEKLQILAAQNDISVTQDALRRLVKKYQETGF